MTNNQKKIPNLPLGNQIFLYSYFVLLLVTLGGFIGAAIASQILLIICTVGLIIALIINIIAAFSKDR